MAPNILTTIPTISENIIAVCTHSLTSLWFLAPKCCEIITLNPDERPTNIPIKRFISVLVVPPTAASPSFPTFCPTMTASAVL